MQDISTLSVAQAVRLLGIGRSTLYGLIKEGRLPVKRTLILREDFDRFIASLPTSGTAE